MEAKIGHLGVLGQFSQTGFFQGWAVVVVQVIQPHHLPALSQQPLGAAKANEARNACNKHGGHGLGLARLLAAFVCGRHLLQVRLQARGNVADAEMHRVFNCGIGMVVVVAEQDAARAQKLLEKSGEQVWHIGHIRRRKRGEAQTIVV